MIKNYIKLEVKEILFLFFLLTTNYLFEIIIHYIYGYAPLAVYLVAKGIYIFPISLGLSYPRIINLSGSQQKKEVALNFIASCFSVLFLIFFSILAIRILF